MSPDVAIAFIAGILTGAIGARRVTYAGARVGVALALTAAIALILEIDAVSPDYEASPLIVAAVLGAIAALVGVELRGIG